EEDAERHDEIGGEIEGNHLGGTERSGGFGLPGGKREQQESGMGDRGIREQALEVRLRDGGQVSEKQRGDGEDEQQREHRTAGDLAREEWLEKADRQDETGGLRADG